MNKVIGGFFDLELNKGTELYLGSIRLNTGRNCLEYILRAENYQKIYLPRYICDAVLEPISRLNINYEYYNLDEELNPVINNAVVKNETLLCVNYFGVKNKTIESISASIKNLIVDNTQALFSKPIKGIDTFYSVRKFFGVPDGAYLFSNEKLKDKIEQDFSWPRMVHLLLRIDKSAEDGYPAFVINEEFLENQPIKIMSKLTQALLQNIDYEKAKVRRHENFLYLHEKLHKLNDLKIDDNDVDAPMAYPLLFPKGKEIRENLIKRKIFVATYWENMKNIFDENSFEAYLSNNLLPLPIDQRYNIDDMNVILNQIKT
ncbi:MAG: hypothetical protein P4L27_08980 [Ignavibacteriaceae bacterium]|nr:hypothetical protein [Ignavibacteriaceae bacterium]